VVNERLYRGVCNDHGLCPGPDESYLRDIDGLISRLDRGPALPLSCAASVSWADQPEVPSQRGAPGRFYAHAAKAGVTFHFHQKRAIGRAYDERDADQLRAAISDREVENDLAADLLANFDPVDEETTIAHLKTEIENPTKLRREVGDRDIAAEISKAQFSAFMWECLPEQDMHSFFDPQFEVATYRASFWQELQVRSSALFGRDRSLNVLRLNQSHLDAAGSLDGLRNRLCGVLRDQYDGLNNYGFLAVLLEPLTDGGRDVQWELAADLTLYARNTVRSSSKTVTSARQNRRGDDGVYPCH